MASSNENWVIVFENASIRKVVGTKEMAEKMGERLAKELGTKVRKIMPAWEFEANKHRPMKQLDKHKPHRPHHKPETQPVQEVGA